MPTGNFDETPAPAPFQLPADYYSTPPVARLPRWLPYGCGGISLFALLMIFLIGGFLAGGGFSVLLDYVLTTTTSEIKTMYVTDVTEDEKREFEQSMKMLSANIDSGKVPPGKVQELLKTILSVTADKKATRREIHTLIELAHKANGQR